jgi:hypothetical protein
MSVTVHQQPTTYVPAYSPQMFVASSNQTAQPDFSYLVVITDLITGEFINQRVPKDINNKCIFDAQGFVKNYLTHYCPINVYGWKQATGIRKIRVNIGEQYSGTLHSGSNIDYIVWNGVVDWAEYPTYAKNTYVYDGTIPNRVYLTNLLIDPAFTNRSNLFYALTSAAGDILQVTIMTYDATGTFLSYSKIANPWQSSTTYTDKYICIDLGLKGLANISSGSVSGTYPIIPWNAAYYEIWNGIPAVLEDGQPTAYFIKRYNIKCEPKYPVYTVHFLAKNGSFETCHFQKRSDLFSKKETSSYRRIPFTYASNTYLYTASTPVERVLSTEVQGGLKLNTDWIDEDHIALYEQLYSSPLVYLDLGTTEYRTLKVVTDSYRVAKKYNEKLFQLEMEFQYTNSDYRQMT